MSGPGETIVFLDRASLPATLRRPVFPHAWIDFDNTSAEQVGARLRDATIAITNKVPLRAEVIAHAPRLRMVAVCATGADNVDLETCRARGIVVSNIRGYAVNAVPEHMFMMLLALRRNLAGWRHDLRAGSWQTSDQFCLFTRPIEDLVGSTLGIVGFGALGRGVERLARAFGIRVLVAAHKGEAAPPGRVVFETVLRESDALSLHAPLTPATRHLIGAPELALMKPTAVLINCARGGLVDEAALAAALRAGRLAGAGFDVLSTEPPRAGNPLLELLELPNFILTPHVAWASRQAMQAMADQLVDNIEGFVQGRPRNQLA